jgi:starvation-inducible DNA-binding protein
MGDNSKKALVDGLNGLLADHLALYVKTKNFHWHVAGPRFRDLHLMFDEQAAQILANVDAIGERVRKNGEFTLTSIGSIAEHTNVQDQNDATLAADGMIEELRDDNARLVKRLKDVKELAGEVGDNATDGLIDDWTDEAEERVWFLTQNLK